MIQNYPQFDYLHIADCDFDCEIDCNYGYNYGYDYCFDFDFSCMGFTLKHTDIVLYHLGNCFDLD